MADGRPGLVNVDQLLASDEQFMLAEAAAMQQACDAAFAGLQVRPAGAAACLVGRVPAFRAAASRPAAALPHRPAASWLRTHCTAKLLA